MGDMADWLTDQAFDCDSDELEWYDADFKYGQRKPSGPGKCPVCRGPTHFVKGGEFGPFYGCNKYPKCNGSWNYVVKKGKKV